MIYDSICIALGENSLVGIWKILLFVIALVGAVALFIVRHAV